MTYFDPTIFCKQNLKDKDRKELEYYHSLMEKVIEFASDNFKMDNSMGISETFEKMSNEIVDNFVEELKHCLGNTFQEETVGIIDGYNETVEEVNEPETFYYEPEEEDDLDLDFTEPEE